MHPQHCRRLSQEVRMVTYRSEDFHRVLLHQEIMNDAQERNSAKTIMMEDIRAREDDATRMQARARIASMANAGSGVVEVPGYGNYFLHASRFASLQLHG